MRYPGMRSKNCGHCEWMDYSKMAIETIHSVNSRPELATSQAVVRIYAPLAGMDFRTGLRKAII
jgi:hypothetical protein